MTKLLVRRLYPRCYTKKKKEKKETKDGGQKWQKKPSLPTRSICRENSKVTTTFSKCISNKSALASFRSNKSEFSNTWLRRTGRKKGSSSMQALEDEENIPPFTANKFK